MSQITNKPLTDAEYIAKGGGICPSCGSDQIEGGAIDVDGPTASQGVHCLERGAEWKDAYKLTGYSNLETATN